MSESSAKAGSPRIAIIGGGFGGLSLAVKLKKAKLDDFTIFEKSAGIGGTWWDNRYPGCEVDVPSHAYCFSFLPHDWTRTHAKSAELRQYAEAVVQRFGLRPHIRLSTTVTAVQWDEGNGRYDVVTSHGDIEQFAIVVSAVGMLNDPYYPDWPGRSDFTGAMVHTARWPNDGLDLQGKRVAVVGTGSTAAQLVPAIREQAEHVCVFQREPGWVLPKYERDLTPDERKRYQRRSFRLARRARLFYRAGKLNRVFDLHSVEQRRLRSLGERYLHKAVSNDDLRDSLRPSYPYGCKRPVLASGFYPALDSSNVELIPKEVTRVTATGVVDSGGVERPFDVVVLATGFHAARYLSTFAVKGRDGISLHEFWGERPRAFLGVSVPGFPNFFILYGPNTNGGWSIIAQLERQAEVVVRAVRRLQRRRYAAIDTRPRALPIYVAWIDRQIARHASAMESGCHNYYHSPSGANVTQWPMTHGRYYILSKLLPRFGLVGERTRRGRR